MKVTDFCLEKKNRIINSHWRIINPAVNLFIKEKVGAIYKMDVKISIVLQFELRNSEACNTRRNFANMLTELCCRMKNRDMFWELCQDMEALKRLKHKLLS